MRRTTFLIVARATVTGLIVCSCLVCCLSSGDNSNKIRDQIVKLLSNEISNPNQLQINKLVSELDVENEPFVVSQDQMLLSDYQPSSCQLIQVVHILHHVGCRPKAVTSFACSGSCSSYVRPSTSELWKHERSCSCCQQTDTQEATFTLDCPSLEPPYRQVKAQAPVACLCRSCTDLSRENLQPQEYVEALAGESSTNNLVQESV